MVSTIRIFGPDTISNLSWPTNDEAQSARNYLVPLIRDGASYYIDNANVQMFAILVDHQVLPMVLCHEASGNSDVCSPTSHYLRYPLAELAKRKDEISALVLKSSLQAAEFFLQRTHLDKVIYLNNWLWTTNPCPSLTASQVDAVTNHLIEKYPDHAILFRSCNKYIASDYFEALSVTKYKMVASRTVYIVDFTREAFKKNDNLRRDRLLLNKGGYEIVSNDDLDEKDIGRMTSLYRNLYLKKHPRLNPQFNQRFFSLVLRENIFTFKALKKKGRIDAFVSYFAQDGVVTGSLVGYDLELPQKLGLYRQAFAILMAAGSAHLLNLSAGAGLFKIFRSARPCIEYDAVYDTHLSSSRRLAWSCIQAGGIFQHFRGYGRDVLM
jgi:hypothetical protein